MFIVAVVGKKIAISRFFYKNTGVNAINFGNEHITHNQYLLEISNFLYGVAWVEAIFCGKDSAAISSFAGTSPPCVYGAGYALTGRDR